MFGFDTASPFRICLPTFAANIWIVKESKTTCRKLISATRGLRKISGTCCDGLVTLAWVGGHGLVGGGEKFGSGRRSESARSLCSSLCPLLASASRGVSHFPKALTAYFLITGTTFLGHIGSEGKRDQFSSSVQLFLRCPGALLPHLSSSSSVPGVVRNPAASPFLPCFLRPARPDRRSRAARSSDERPNVRRTGTKSQVLCTGTRAATRRGARCSERERRVVDTPW